MTKRPTVHEIIESSRLTLSPAFVARLEAQGRDVDAAKRATAELLMAPTGGRWGRARVPELIEKYREGLIDIHATHNNGHFPLIRPYRLYHTLLHRDDWAALVAEILPDVSDDLFAAPLPAPGGQQLRAPLFAVETKPNILRVLLNDPRTDPWTQKKDGSDFVAAAFYLARICLPVQDCVPENLAAQQASTMQALMETGIPAAEFRTMRGLKEFITEADALWNGLQMGQRDAIGLSISEIRMLASLYGYEAVFDPALWRGAEATALERIGQLPHWVQPLLVRAQPVLESALPARSWSMRFPAGSADHSSFMAVS